VRSLGCQPQRAAGFSLVEVLCALLVLGVGLVGVTEGITYALRASKDSQHATAAALLAAGRIEELRADGFITPGEEEGDCGDDVRLYSYVEKISETSIDGLYEVSVAILFKSSEERVYELKTLLFDPPLVPADTASSTSGDPRRETDRAAAAGRRRL